MPEQPEMMEELFLDELRDLYDAEKQLTKALPKLAKAAGSGPLQAAFKEHLDETKRQAERIETIFEQLDEKPRSRPCLGMKGIIDEGQEHIEEGHEPPIMDTVLTGAGRKTEHYEMAAYLGAVELAGALGNKQAVRLLQQSLAEEERMDRKLAQLSGRMLKGGSKAGRKAA